MQIIIDGYKDLVIVEEHETLGEILAQLRKWVKDNKRVIVKILLEGKPIPLEEKEEIQRRKAKEFGTLELFTFSAWQLAINTLEEVDSHLPRLMEGLERVSFLIQSADYKRGFSLLRDCINLWDTVNKALERIEKILALDYTQLFFKGEKITDKMEEFVKLLKQANEAIEEGDLLALSDLLEYEFIPRIKEEREVVKKITEIAYRQLN